MVRKKASPMVLCSIMLIYPSSAPVIGLLALLTPVDYICPSSGKFFVLCFPIGPVPLSIQSGLSLLIAVILCSTLSWVGPWLSAPPSLCPYLTLDPLPSLVLASRLLQYSDAINPTGVPHKDPSCSLPSQVTCGMCASEWLLRVCLNAFLAVSEGCGESPSACAATLNVFLVTRDAKQSTVFKSWWGGWAIAWYLLQCSSLTADSLADGAGSFRTI